AEVAPTDPSEPTSQSICSGFRRFNGGLCIGGPPSHRTGPMNTTTLAETTADLHISRFTTLPAPDEIATELPIGDERASLVARTRDEVRAIMAGEDDRLLVVAGPCSIHDTA